MIKWSRRVLNWLWHRVRALGNWGLLFSLVLTVLLVTEELRRQSPSYTSDVFERLDYLYYDTRMRALPAPDLTDEPNIVIIDIDEKSLAEKGRWPWSRGVLTVLNEQLLDAGVYTITY
ncbi:MAG: CHASE2 domain-containing protein, partial [Natronospirillum sp.]